MHNRYAVSPATASQADYPTGSLPYAGFWKRAAAYVIDYVLVAVAMQVVALILIPKPAGGPRNGGLFILLLAIAGCLYYALLESSSMQATLGKRALGIKVTDLQGERIGFGRALGRLFGHILSFLIFGIGFAMAVFTERRQTLHDKMAGTLVVNREEAPEDIQQAGAAPAAPMWQSIAAVLGFVLFGPFGIGMLAAIAIPAYQDYTLRSQIAEGLVLANSYKTAVGAAVADGASLNSIDSASLSVSFPDTAQYVDSIKVVHGAIDIQYGRRANRKITGGHLFLVPELVGGTQLQWSCGNPINIPDKLLPRACRTGNPTGGR